jgi:hypothetical protein
MKKVRRRTEVNAEKAARASVFQDWFQDRLAAAQKRTTERRKLAAQSEPEGGGHGVTVAMRNVRRPEPLWIHQHTGKPARDLRHDRDRDTGKVRTWPRDLRASSTNVPYVNPARDLKPGRWWKLRPERQIELSLQLAKFRARRDAGGKHRGGGSNVS